MPKSTAIVKPSLGLYLDRPPIAVPPNALQAGLNFRVQLGAINNLNMGWGVSGIPQLNGPVMYCNNFNTSTGSQYLVLATPTDIYYWSGTTLTFLTPIYATGTVAASGTAVTGTTTAWATTPTGSQWANAKAGDQIYFGSATENSPTATWYTIATVNSGTSITLTSSAGTVSGGTAYTIRRLFTGDINNYWFSETFTQAAPEGTDELFMTNGVDNVVRWNGTNAQVLLMTAFGFTCKYLCQFKNMMLYLNVTNGNVYQPTQMLNSDAGSPSNVGNASTGIAGSFRVQGGTDPIINAYRLQDYLAIYCGRTIIMVYATGDTLVFAFRLAVANKGPISSRGISIYPAIHQFIAPDCMYQFDGTSAQVINTHVWRSILSSLDTIRAGTIFTVLDEQNGEQIWSVPQSTDSGAGTITSPNQKGWTEHYLEESSATTLGAEQLSRSSAPNPYSSRQLTNMTSFGYWTRESTTTWNELTQAWNTYSFRWNSSFFAASYPFILAGDSSGNVWILNGSQYQQGNSSMPLAASVTFGRRALSDGRNRSLLRRIYPFCNSFPNNLDVTIGLADFAGGPATITETFEYNAALTPGLFMVPIYRRGRYVDVGFGSAVGTPFILQGYDTDVLPGGFR
jgi:hypothetical protein